MSCALITHNFEKKVLFGGEWGQRQRVRSILMKLRLNEAIDLVN